MRMLTIALLFFLCLTAEECKHNAVYDIELRITKTASYCGGAAPPESLIRELRRPTPYLGGPLFVFNSNLVCIDSFMDLMAESALKRFLPMDTYTLRLVNELTLFDGTNDREKCLHDWKERIMGRFVVQNDSTQTVNVHLDCNPCYPPPP